MTMRKKIVAGNWKMNLTIQDALSLVQGIENSQKCCTYIFPSFVFLTTLHKKAKEKGLLIGGQNCHYEKSGAFTGEVSIVQLKELAMDAVLIGHSERRSLFGENDSFLKKKIDAALAYEITPFFCCGETLEERKTKRHFDLVGGQIEKALFHLDSKEISKVIIAYEPLWAIGTGETASPEQAEEMHAHIRGLLAKNYGSSLAESISILYGGSCNPSNAKELFSQPNIDGGLIGGAALKIDDFNQIISSF